MAIKASLAIFRYLVAEFPDYSDIACISECLEDGLRAGDSDISTGFNLCVADFSMVNDQGVAASTIAARPANTLGKLGISIGGEKLSIRQ